MRWGVRPRRFAHGNTDAPQAKADVRLADAALPRGVDRRVRSYYSYIYNNLRVLLDIRGRRVVDAADGEGFHSRFVALSYCSRL